MEREKLIRIGTDVAVGVFAAWLLKQLGIKQGTVAAAIGMVLLHEMLDAPVAAHLNATF